MTKTHTRFLTGIVASLACLSLCVTGVAVASPESAVEDPTEQTQSEDNLEEDELSDDVENSEDIEEEIEDSTDLTLDEDEEDIDFEDALPGEDLVDVDSEFYETAEAQVFAEPRATPTSIAGFRRENIISDQVFYNSQAMNEAQIQQFLQRENASCKSSSNAKCIKDMTFPTQNLTTLRGACKPLGLSGNQPAWTIIARTATACGLNPQVILATIQKESSGIYQPLTPDRWAKSMGSGCPDGQVCSAQQSGFTSQIYYGADKLASYRLDKSWPNISAVANGTPVSIKNSATPGCSSTSTFKIENYATASLYMYTPYTPSDAQIAAYPGTVACGHPGYLTFYKYMNQWFPGSVGAAKPKPKPTAKLSRVGGQNRVGTAVAVSKHQFNQANVVYLVNQFSPVDATVAGTLPQGPILYTSKDNLPAATSEEINRLGAKRVIAIGGSGVVSDSLLSQFKNRGISTSRLGGKDRIDTAIAISKYLYPNGNPKSVYVAGALGSDGSGSPDAVAGANLKDGPILLSYENRSLDSRTRTEINRLKANVYELGGIGLGTGGTKIFGADRYKTSVQIAKRAYGNTPDTVYLVRSDNPIDAVAAGTLTKGPRLLVHPYKEGFNQCEYLRAARPKTVIVIGGAGAISDATANRAAICAAGG